MQKGKRQLISGAICLLIFVFVAGTDKANKSAGTFVPGNSFDAAPFGSAISETDGKAHGLQWSEPRKIRRLVVEFEPDAKLPPADKIRVQYWHNHWDGRPDRILAEVGAGHVGWAAMDDWTNGQWKDADTRLEADGNRWTFTFKSTGEKEFEKVGQAGVGYRKTLKIRIASERPFPRPAKIQAFTDAVCRSLTTRIMLGKPAADSSIKLNETETGRLEVYNGILVNVRPIEGNNITVNDNMQWTLPAGSTGGLEADIIMAVDPVSSLYDRTIATVRSNRRPFSFSANEVARGDHILIDDLGVLVVRGDDATTLAGLREARKEFPGKTVYERIFDESEQTLSRAWNDMPLKHPLYFVHGLPGDRNLMRHQPNGSVEITAVKHWFDRPKSPKDTERKGWPGDYLDLDFGFPAEHLRGGRELQDGYLPVLRTWWQDGPIYYEQTAFLDKLDSNLSDIQLDDPTVLMMRIKVVNTSDTNPATAELLLTSRPRGGEEQLQIQDERALTLSHGKPQIRYLIQTGKGGKLESEGPGMRWSHKLEPLQAHSVYFKIPSITIDKDEEIAALSTRDFEADRQKVCEYWKQLTEKGTQIDTPEPWLNDFYKTHLRHMLVSCYKEIGSERLYAHVGSFHYGVYPDESGMMISDLDRRGYHEQAERCLESFLHYQGTVVMPGNFKSKQGIFYSAGGHEMGGYNKSHGWVMWNMAEHWRYTRDRTWMERAAPKLVEACEWVIRERRATMTENKDGTRPIEYGWLPSGSLEDVHDYWYWLVTNVCMVWGFEALAEALADYGHPQGQRLQQEARAFRDDVMAGVNESRIRAPVVRLRDGTYVPKYPSRLYERGRCYGWLRETLEGSIHLLITGMLEPDTPEAKWIINDFEDNLYISDDYGYSIPAFDQFWFSRGGFSMQANLLGGTLPYLYRDEIKHYLRAYFNAFTSAFYPEVRMCNEHSLPELGYPRGDHFKPSDEAQSTYWLRLMFVNERDGNLYLGQAIPRYWLADGKSVGIERAASHFGPLSLRISSLAAVNEIKAVVTPPQRNRPENIFVRIRHPEGKPIKSVTLNGSDYDKFDSKKEWIILPGNLQGVQEIVARY